MLNLALLIVVFIAGMLFSKFLTKFGILPRLANKFKTTEVKETQYWHSKVRLWDQIQGNAEVVAFGDSITEGANWNELIHGTKVINRGISGDTSFGLVKRLHQVTKLSPKIVFIMVGVNDFGYGVNVDDVFLNYKKIVEVLTQRGIIVVVHSTLYSSKKYRLVNSKINLLNEKLSEYCLSNNFEYLDLNETLSPDGFLKEINTYDGIHLSAEGYLAWATMIRDVLNKLNNR